MKNSGTCPKCGSTRTAEVKSDALGARIGTGAFSIAEASYYVCCQCGFTEEWVVNANDLKKLWKKHSD